jgi:long-subunit fatty acid transport protein
MKYIIKIIGISIILSSAMFAEVGGKTSLYEFLRNESSSRAAGLGGSFVSFANDPNIIFYNPAGLATLNFKMASFGFLKHLMDVNAGYLSYVQQLDILDGYIGMGIQYYNYGGFEELNEVGEKIGDFNAGDLALSVGYATKTETNFYYGINLKLIYSSIATISSAALAGDVGFFYSIPSEEVNIGLSIQNFGVELKTYDGLSEDLPLDVKIGISKKLEHLPLNINLNFHHLNFSYNDFVERFKAFSVGGEFTLSQYFKLRVGYNNLRRLDLKLGFSSGMAGLSLGVGAQINKYLFDYAFTSYGAIGGLHRINLTTSL